MSYLKKGAAAQQAMAQQEAKQAAAQKDNIRRYYLPSGASGSLTFLDGDLDENGILDIPMYYEHQIHMNGHWRNWFVCTQDQEPCPLCEGGDEPGLVGVLSVIDHNVWKDKQGNEHKDEKRLFVAKFATIQSLQQKAIKRKGLAGCTFDVFRSTDKKSANVGSDFDFTEKHTHAGLVKKYGEDAEPFNYEEVIGYMEAKELRKLGFGVTGVGGEPALKDGEGSGEEYEKDL